MTKTSLLATFCSVVLSASALADVTPPQGFTALFNGVDLSGWRGGETFDHRALLEMTEEDRAKKIAAWTETMRAHWRAENEEFVNDGKGAYATTEKDYGDFELTLEYKTVAKADSGIYLRGVPQVQIWDSTDSSKFALGADKGSGALWNNTPGTPGRDPLVLADKPLGEWNQFRIVMVGSRVSVWLNGKMTVDHALMQNYYDGRDAKMRSNPRPVPARGPIQLQTHGGEIRWKNIFLREIPADEANRILASKADGFEKVFNGTDLTGWTGALENYEVKDGAIVCKEGKGGTLHTQAEYSDFVARVEFRVPAGGNNGLAIRYSGKGNPAFEGGMTELQVLDDDHAKYSKIDPRQYHGSVYGMIAPHRGYLRPVGEWNFEEVTVQGSRIIVELNGNIILDGDVAKVDPATYMKGHTHGGKDRTSGSFGFAGHSDPVSFRAIAIKKL